MTIGQRHCGGILVLDVTGRLSGPEAADTVGDTIRRLGRAGVRTMVINLSRVRALDPLALAALLAAHAEVSATGSELRLAGVARSIGSDAVMSKLASTWKLFDSVDEALDGPIGSAPARREHHQ